MWVWFIRCINIGFVEALMSNLGKGGSLLRSHCDLDDIEHCIGLPDGYIFKLIYGSIILLFCLFVCLVGAGNILLY